MEQRPAAPATLAGRLRWLLGLRIVVATVMLGATVAIQIREGEDFLATPLRGLYLAVGAAYLLTIVYALLLPQVRDLRRFAVVQLGGDLVLLSGVVLITGGVTSPFLVVYFLVIIGAAILFYRPGGIAAAAAGAVLYGIAVGAPFFPRVATLVDIEGAYRTLSPATVGYRHLLTVFGFFLVAFLASHLTESLRRMGHELSAASASLAELERRNELILQSIASGLVTTDLEGRIAYANRAAERIGGIAAAEVIGRPFGEVFRVPGREVPWLRPGRLGGAPLRLDGGLAGRGEEPLLGMTFSPLVDEAGLVSGVICSFQDLTRIRRMEEQVRRSDRLAAVGELAAGMAHEIRNPLASMSGSIQLLSEGLRLQGEDRELMEIVTREVGRLNALITDFLQYASPRPPERRPTDLAALARETATLLAQARGPGCRIDVVPEGNEPCRARVDPKLLRQVFWNLSLNAVEAMPGGGSLRVALGEREDGTVWLSFSDEGPGIPPEELPRIFTPFHSTKEGGTGLGLPVVHRIVEAHGGRLEIENRQGGGDHGAGGAACGRSGRPGRGRGVSELPRVLVVDDEPGIRRVLSVMLRKEGCTVESAGGRAELEERLTAGAYDLLITDMRMPDLTGLEVLRLAQDRNPGIRSIVMTAFPSADATIQAIQKGALDYVTKEGDYLDRLRRLVREGIARGGREEAPAPLAVRSERRTDYLVGSSPAMLEIFKVVGRVADRKSTVLITGESGTGKELVARAIHAHSGRRDRPLVSINCGAITETLLESELFGHVKGSFTGAVADKKGLFEAADGGTLFLDEIGETTKAVQVKLLRVLQEEAVRRVGDTRDIPVDVRIIAATNQDLLTLARTGAFREDLYFRLNVIPIHVPPLRERPEDIPELARYFLERYGGSETELSPGALEAILACPWPGNVRELENLLERVVAMHPGEAIQAEFLPESVLRGDRGPAAAAAGESGIPPEGIRLEEAVDAYERGLILRALEATGGKRPEAARLLGLTLRSFRYRLDKHGL